MLAGKQFHGQKSLLGYTRWDGRVGHGWVTNAFIFNSYDGIIYAIISKYNIISIYWVPSMLLLLSPSVMSDSVWPHRRQPNKLPHPWDSPGTRVGCHFLLQCMKVKSEREVAQLCPTLHNPMDCSLPGFSIHGIFQAKVLERGAISFSGVPSVGFPKSFFLIHHLVVYLWCPQRK